MHRSFRMLLNSSFAPKIVEGSRERVRQIAGELIDRFKDRGRCEVQADYANHLPVLVFMEMMDLPAEDAVQIKFWSDQITRLEGHLTMA
jgi:cytochrome P450